MSGDAVSDDHKSIARGVTVFARSFWHWWTGFFVLCVVEFDVLNRFSDRPGGLKVLVLSACVAPVAATICAAGLRYFQTVEVSPSGIRLRVPVYKPTVIRFDDADSMTYEPPLGFPQFTIRVGRRARKLRVPAYMGAAAFLDALERAGAGESRIAAACRDVLLRRRTPPNN